MSNSNVKFPKITVQLLRTISFHDLFYKVDELLKNNGISEEEIFIFRNEAMHGDYNNLLLTAKKWVSINESTSVKFPEITVQLTDVDSNAFSIIGAVVQELKRYRIDPMSITRFYEEATSGDYDNVLQTCMKWVNII